MNVIVAALLSVSVNCGCPQTPTEAEIQALETASELAAKDAWTKLQLKAIKDQLTEERTGTKGD